MTHQAVAETLHQSPEVAVLRLELRERALQAVTDLYASAAQGTHQLVLVVARHAQRVAGADHAHHEPQHPR